MIAPTGAFLPWGSVLLLFAALGFGVFFWRAWRLYRFLRLGRPEARLDHPWRRLRDELVIYLGQGKLLKRPYYVRGLAHAKDAIRSRRPTFDEITSWQRELAVALEGGDAA